VSFWGSQTWKLTPFLDAAGGAELSQKLLGAVTTLAVSPMEPGEPVAP
jgi:hypothetical protein